MKEKLTYRLISKYKMELMGVAAISVLITHASDTIVVSGMPYIFRLISKFGSLFGSQMYMFFFLSGMGEYSCVMKSHFRKFGNQNSGTRKSPILCLMTYPFLLGYLSRPCRICGA